MRIRPRLSASHKCRTRTCRSRPPLTSNFTQYAFFISTSQLLAMLCARRCQGNQTYGRAGSDANKGRRTWPRERIPDFRFCARLLVPPPLTCCSRLRLQFDCLNFIRQNPKCFIVTYTWQQPRPPDVVVGGEGAACVRVYMPKASCYLWSHFSVISAPFSLA